MRPLTGENATFDRQRKANNERKIKRLSGDFGGANRFFNPFLTRKAAAS